jgi:pantoate kinase
MRAHAPGSVTALFIPAVEEHRSRGVSFTTEHGVTAELERSDGPEPMVLLDGERTGFDPVERALAELGVSPRVRLTAEIPVGCGFGASGAATLASVLAANELYDLGHDREALVETAHGAEMAAGTGQGDVFVQALGGLVWSGEADGPPERIELTTPVEYTSFGGIPTAEVLGDEAAVQRARRAGTELLKRFDPEAGLAGLFELGWAFARRTGLTTERVVDAVERVEEAGGDATMAMVGESVVGVGAEDVLAERTRITTEGARVL